MHDLRVITLLSWALWGVDAFADDPPTQILERSAIETRLPFRRPAIRLCDAARTLSFFVDRGAAGGDGSAARPFGSFGQALQAAAARDACKLTIEAGPGEYAESISTRIPSLAIKSRTSNRPVLRGSIDHTNGGLLELVSIDIVRANRYGIRQVGGRLSLVSVRITDTQAAPSEIDSGIGLWVSGGGQAVVRLCVLERNAMNAIRAEGQGTRAWLVRSIVRGTGAHPLALSRIGADPHAQVDIGAVVVTRSAAAWLSGMTIEDSVMAGLTVTHGATVRLDHGVVRRVTGEAARGLHVASEATLEWIDTTVSDCVLCGVALYQAFATARGGSITRASIGLCTRSPRSPTSCMRGPRYMDVRIPLQADSYEAPSLGGAPEPACPGVPAEPLPPWL